MIFVFDRNIEDVMRAIELRGLIAQYGYDTLSAAERSQWEAGLKGAYNASDLMRVENNCRDIAALFNSHGYSVTVDTFHGWTDESIPTIGQMARIRQNVQRLRGALPLRPATPATPASLSVMDIEKANHIERILYEANNAILNTQKTGRYLNTFYAGGMGL